VRPGGADPAAVLDIISDNVPAPAGTNPRGFATGIVEALEVGGYRIVRAGMVPQLDPLKRTADAMRAASAVITPTDMKNGRVLAAAQTIDMLGTLAAAVLGLDLDDVDQHDGTAS
jgi:hypothetical protein